eukprot:349047-Ditylum_brightwellii.AAC.1
MDLPPADEHDTSMEGVDPPTAMLIIWLLRKRAIDGSKLIASIEQGPRGVQFFCTPEGKKKK